MSEMSTKNEAYIKNNELVVAKIHEESVTENTWIIGFSKTHPGLKYYFNTITGISLWNISKEDMERAKQTMKVNGNQPQFLNCPEPKDPPPSNSNSTNLPYCEHVSRQSQCCNKQLLNSGLSRATSGFTCDISSTSTNSQPNFITVNFRACPHLTCISTHDNAYSTVAKSQIQSPTTLLDPLMLEKNHCNKGLINFLGNTRSVDQGPSNEHLHNQSNLDSDFLNLSSCQIESLDLTPLKVFANNGVIKDKWYIIADADIYLNHITLLKSVVRSDSQCCLMLPQNVKVELENATKTELRTKAYCANYYICKMVDSGFAHIDEDNSKYTQDKSNEENVLYCCSKLKEKNFYVVVISNDRELQKYRNKNYIPMFTVAELKENLLKNNHSITIKSTKATYNVLQSSKNDNIAPNIQSKLCNKLPNTHHSIMTSTERNLNIETTKDSNSNGVQIQSCYVGSKITADAEVQANSYCTQKDEKRNFYKKHCLPDQNDEISKSNYVPIRNIRSQEASLNRSSGLSKRVKLRRKRISDQTEQNKSISLGNVSEEHHIDVNDIMSVSTFNDNMSTSNKGEVRNEAILNTNQNLNSNKISTTNTFNPTLKSVRDKSSQFKTLAEDIENKNVMFEVTTEVMDQSLRTKCDEWISRFVQIIEEALTQILRKNSSLYLPPPWNMYEAILCIENKFKNDEDVADASKKFLNVLNKIRNEKGNINANISPTQYMEMYSFGVYLIDALQGMFSTCEDLQTAAESLSKLLYDIQDPDSDMLNLETFRPLFQEEHINNNSENVNDDKVEVFMIIETESLSNEGSSDVFKHKPDLTETVTNEDHVSCSNIEKSGITSLVRAPSTSTKKLNNCVQNEDHSSKNHNQRKAINIECNDKSSVDNNIICSEDVNVCGTVPESSINKYGVISREVIVSPEKHDELSLLESNVVENDIYKNEFLSNLLLERNKVSKKPYNYGDCFNQRTTTTSEDISNNLDSCNTTKANEGCSYKFNSRASDVPHKEDPISNEPRFIRKFVICSEFEDRLKTRQIDDEMEEYYFKDELMETDYIDKDASTENTGQFHFDEYPDSHDNVDRHTEVETAESAKYFKIDFKYMIRRIAQEIKELSLEVYSFSQKSCEALQSLCTSNFIRDTRETAEQIHLRINKICIALTNIYNRDKNGGYNLQELLKHTELDDVLVDEDEMKLYQTFIARCLEQAQDLKNIVKDVSSTVCDL